MNQDSTKVMIEHDEVIQVMQHTNKLRYYQTERILEIKANNYENG